MNSNIRDNLNWTGPKKQHGYDMTDLLKEMGLVKEVPVLHIWAKEFCKNPLIKIEREILKKFNFWTKSMKEDRRNAFIGMTHYWILTELGEKEVSLLFLKFLFLLNCILKVRFLLRYKITR